MQINKKAGGWAYIMVGAIFIIAPWTPLIFNWGDFELGILAFIISPIGAGLGIVMLIFGTKMLRSSPKKFTENTGVNTKSNIVLWAVIALIILTAVVTAFIFARGIGEGLGSMT